MSSETSSVTIEHPSPAALKVINPIMRFLLGTPFSGPLRQQMMILNFKGRKSGKPYSVVLSAHHANGATYAITNAPWKANFVGGPTVELFHNRRTTTMRSEYIRDPEVVADLSHQLATKYGPKRAQRSMGLKFRDANAVPGRDDFLVNIRANGIVAIRMTPA
jgi:hypothetical protein